MNEFKKQGQLHHRNKTRFKDHAKFAPKANGQQKKDLPVNVLPKNWSRYDESDDEILEDDEIVSSKDFGVLSQGQVSQGAYFQFKTDKQFLPDDDTQLQIDSDIFQLDLNVLNLGISSIPFYERMNIDPKIFLPQHLEEMHSTATKNKAIFDTFLEGHSINKETIVENKSFTSNLVDMIENVDICDNEINDQSENKPADNNIFTKNKDVEELEDWLDDILG
ncbi:PREDICTED: uncharacterized protein LOC108569217 [Nicrophorus vespilloides]|uniref:Uncharacterized protein LOC108569217 n=1 Tax=Nicrophorus vespilloides TaxID=110193 RepID=A0ABM1NH67_NICVS|nr:PREDICTED: uncharacterized protein LOC108569217 [Nicrophorus vespilloides]